MQAAMPTSVFLYVERRPASLADRSLKANIYYGGVCNTKLNCYFSTLNFKRRYGSISKTVEILNGGERGTAQTRSALCAVRFS